MEELIRKIELILIETGQHDLKFKLGEIIKYNPKEVGEILRKHKDELRQRVMKSMNNEDEKYIDTGLISRKQANDALQHDATVLGITPYDSGYTPFDAILTLHTLKSSPAPSRPQAEMIQESYYSDRLVCSNCGTEARWDFEFCPYCGFKFKQTGGAV